MLKIIMVKNWILSKIAFISFHGRMLKTKNLKMDQANFENYNLRMLTSNNIKAWSKYLFFEQQCLECKFCVAL